MGAAAVTTVIAIAASVHAVTGDSDDGAKSGKPQAASGREEARASRADGRGALPGKGGAASPSARPADVKPATLADRLGARFPLPAGLALGGAFTVAGGHEKPAKPGARAYTYRVDIENGLRLDGDLFARFVQQTLNDSRSWAHGGAKSFERISSGTPDFVVTLASPGTVAKWCGKVGLDTAEQNVSCDAAGTPRVMINAYRWAQGATTFGDDMLGYRRMLVNHEVGHRLGHNHEFCTRAGALAPVMMQQTKTLTTNGLTCKPNPWPFPPAA